MNRLVIFAYSSDNGKLFSYQYYLLHELKTISNHVITICQNSTPPASIYENMSGVEWRTSTYRFDVNMWQETLLGLKEIILSEYDEIILLNDSFFGPLYPLKDIFQKIDNYETDFWGLTVHGKIPKNSSDTSAQEEWPRFLQRYFMVFHKKVFSDCRFWDFWNRLPIFCSYDKTEKEYEFILTDTFEKMGYRWQAYSDTTEWEHPDNKKYISFLLFRPYRLLCEKKLPIISKQVFLVPKEIELCYSCDNEIGKALQYIDKNTTYDIHMILDCLINTVNIYFLWEKLNLTYILGKCNNNYISKHKVAVFAHLYYSDLFEQSIRYLQMLPKEIDLILSTNKENLMDLKKICQKAIKSNYTLLSVENKGREWRALLIDAKPYLSKYDYICFLHDKKSKQMYYSSMGETFNTLLWENMVGSPEYVSSIIEKLHCNEQLGLLSPPVVYQGEFWTHYPDFWTICYDKTFELAQKIGLTHLPEKNYPVLTIGSCFWAKTSALKKLLQYPFSEDDFMDEPLADDGTINHALERILAFAAQDEGYYTGIVMNSEFAMYDTTNYISILRNLLTKLKDIHGIDTTTLYSTLKSFEHKNISISNKKTGHKTLKTLIRRFFS